MSYLTQAQLMADATFQARITAVNLEQSQVFKDDSRADIAATALAILRDDPGPSYALLRLAVSLSGASLTRSKPGAPSTRVG